MGKWRKIFKGMEVATGVASSFGAPIPPIKFLSKRNRKRFHKGDSTKGAEAAGAASHEIFNATFDDEIMEQLNQFCIGWLQAAYRENSVQEEE